MSQISPPIRILLVSAVAFMAAWMLFLRPKDDAGAPAPSTPTPTASRDPWMRAGTRPPASPARPSRRPTRRPLPRTPRPSSSPAVPARPPPSRRPRPRPPPPRPRRRRRSRAPSRAPSPSRTPRLRPAAPRAPRARSTEGRRAALLVPEGGLRTAPCARRSQASTAITARCSPRPRTSSASPAIQQITRGADVTQSPTVVIIDRNRKVETLVGYVDRLTIDQAVTDACATRSGTYTRRVDAEAFAEHLQFPRGRGHAPAASFSGTAGGAVCGDLVRIDLRGRRRPRSPTPASRRRAAARRWRPARRRSSSCAARRLLDAARIGARARWPRSWAGSRPASCTRPSWPPTRCTSRSARR